jgi:hypothetical protein
MRRARTMRKVVTLVAGVVIALTGTVAALARDATRSHAESVMTIRDLSFEFVGQLINSPPGVTPLTHMHYGYLSYVRGLPAFKGAPADEATALFTFFAPATTVRVIDDGPMRVITRVGTLTIYRDPTTNGSFSNPDTFRDGTPVLVASFRVQAIVDTASNTFTTFHQNRITSTKPFLVGRGKVQLGEVGEQFTTEFTGHINMPGPPSGYFAGHAVSG